VNIRLQLFELEDQSWFPHIIRQGMLDFLRFMIAKLYTYREALPLLEELLVRTNQTHVTDLCSGAGGGIETIQQGLSQRMGQDIKITLSDLYPNIIAYQYLQQQSGGTIDYISEPVDATAVPRTITGIRTIFSSFHHFQPTIAQHILQDAANNRVAIGIFEGAKKSWMEMVLLFFFPIIIFIVTPFIRPFKVSRLFFTYIIPIIPIGIIWDGFVSLLRIYPPEHLLRMAQCTNAPNYTWRAGRLGSKPGKHIIYIIGYPN
jgi:hypothetical protein